MATGSITASSREQLVARGTLTVGWNVLEAGLAIVGGARAGDPRGRDVERAEGA
jgi:hypothetical protein